MGGRDGSAGRSAEKGGTRERATRARWTSRQRRGLEGATHDETAFEAAEETEAATDETLEDISSMISPSRSLIGSLPRESVGRAGGLTTQTPRHRRSKPTRTRSSSRSRSRQRRTRWRCLRPRRRWRI